MSQIDDLPPLREVIRRHGLTPKKSLGQNFLHDLNLTAMYADRIFVLSRGQLASAGSPADVLKDELIERVFDCRLKVGALPAGSVPFVLPQSAA